MDFNLFNAKELRALCRANNVSESGNKARLVAALQQAHAQNAGVQQEPSWAQQLYHLSIWVKFKMFLWWVLTGCTFGFSAYYLSCFLAYESDKHSVITSHHFMLETFEAHVIISIVCAIILSVIHLSVIFWCREGLKKRRNMANNRYLCTLLKLAFDAIFTCIISVYLQKHDLKHRRYDFAIFLAFLQSSVNCLLGSMFAQGIFDVVALFLGGLTTLIQFKISANKIWVACKFLAGYLLLIGILIVQSIACE